MKCRMCQRLGHGSEELPMKTKLGNASDMKILGKLLNTLQVYRMFCIM